MTIELMGVLSGVQAFVAQNRALGGLIIFFLLAVLADIAHGQPVKEVLRERWRRIIDYIAAIMIAHQLDFIFINDIMHWEYQSTFLVTLFLASREAKTLLEYMAKRGLTIPVLNYRISKMMELEASDASVEEIRRLTAELRTLRETRQSAEPPDQSDTSSVNGPTI